MFGIARRQELDCAVLAVWDGGCDDENDGEFTQKNSGWCGVTA